MHFAFVMVATMAILGVHPAWAHSKLQSLSASRSDGRVQFRLRFSAPIEVAFSRFSVSAENTKRTPIPLRADAGSARETELWLHGPALTPGLYRFQGAVLSADGHRQQEIRSIEVR